LIISNNVQVYFITSNNFDFAQVTLLGNGGLHQLVLDSMVVVPEPSVLLLLAGGGLILRRFRRGRRECDRVASADATEMSRLRRRDIHIASSTRRRGAYSGL
jgi:hypothetical protein